MIFQLDRQVGKDVNPIRFSYCKKQKKLQSRTVIWRNDFGAGQEAKKEPSSKRTMTYVRVWLFFQRLFLSTKKTLVASNNLAQ